MNKKIEELLREFHFEFVALLKMVSLFDKEEKLKMLDNSDKRILNIVNSAVEEEKQKNIKAKKCFDDIIELCNRVLED